MKNKQAPIPGELLRSLDNPSGTVRAILEGSLEQALGSRTDLPLPADSGISTVSYPILLEGLLRGLDTLLEGKDLDLLSMKATKRVASILEDLLRIGVPEGKDLKDIAPDFRLLVQDLLIEGASPSSFAWSDIYLRFRDTDLEDLQSFLSASQVRSAEHALFEVYSRYWKKKFSPRADAEDALKAMKKLLAYLEASASNLDLNGGLWALWRTKELKFFSSSIFRASEANLEKLLILHFSHEGSSEIPGDLFSSSNKSGMPPHSYNYLAYELAKLKENLGKGIKELERNLKKAGDKLPDLSDYLHKTSQTLYTMRCMSEALEEEGYPAQGSWAFRKDEV